MLIPQEKVVNVLLDEIYITPAIDYKGGHLVGSAENVANLIKPATTIQTYMIVSPFSSNKDVVAMHPVKNLNAETLYMYTKDVLRTLVDCGFSPLCLISDNNRINRNMFLKFCCNGDAEVVDSEQNESDMDVINVQIPSHQTKKEKKKQKKPKLELLHSIPNPYQQEERLFFLFDSPHLIKSVRNNWLNQTQTNERLYFPNPEKEDVVLCASLSSLKNLYDVEKSSIVKLAPKLSRKVLFPSSFERQNVLYALNLFHESNAMALTIKKDNYSEGTKTFITTITNWWKIVNVKQHEKGHNKKDPFCDPIFSPNDPNIKYLENFALWMKAWGKYKSMKPKDKKACNIPTKGGFLSNETQFALQFSTSSLVELVKYVFNKYTLKYLLLGTFQTDNIEGCFGQYRQMNGGNYNLSCPQVFETEHKLKILSLIRLHSHKFGEFHLKDFNCGDHLEIEEDEIPEAFYDVFNSHDDITIDTSTHSVLIYIAGYVAYKVTSHLQCNVCIRSLVVDKQLECEIPDDDVSQYLHLTSRGGLKWPQKFVVDILICVYTTFIKLISHKYEQKFFEYKKQRNLVVMICHEKWDLLQMSSNIDFSDEHICNECNLKISVLVKRCMTVAANIMLNNYTKVFNNKKEFSKKRKLATLTN